MRRKQTKEMKVAKLISESVNDFDIDLEAVGESLAKETSSTIYNRLYTVAEATKYYKEQQYDRFDTNFLR